LERTLGPGKPVDPATRLSELLAQSLDELTRPFDPPRPAALRVAGGGTSSVGELRARLLARWVAENLLAEQRARGEWLPLGMQRGKEREGGIEFAWREEVIATPNVTFRRVDIRVFAAPEEAHALAHLTGFIVNPPGTDK